MTLTTGVVKEEWPLRKELDTDRLRPRAGSASWRPAGGGRGEKDDDEEEDEEGEVWEAWSEEEKHGRGGNEKKKIRRKQIKI